jgi:arsenite oxidase small subunit
MALLSFSWIRHPEPNSSRRATPLLLFQQPSGHSQTLNCPGHYSRFDCEAGGQQIWGQATQNLPQYTLRVDSNGDIYAEGLDELLYGRLSNVL